MKFEMKQATDAKSLYDLLIAENPASLEKRSVVAVRSVQQTMPPQAIHWLPTGIMHADGLTNLEAAAGTCCMVHGSMVPASSRHEHQRAVEGPRSWFDVEPLQLMAFSFIERSLARKLRTRTQLAT